jgi:hypothetical protein
MGKAIGVRLQGPCYLNRDEHERNIRVREKRKDIGKYSFVNRTINLWNQLPAEALETFPSRSNIFKKKVGKVIISVK